MGLATHKRTIASGDISFLVSITDVQYYILILILDISFEEDLTNRDENQVDPTFTYCECVEIVLPQHANHHETTFGGQVKFLHIMQLFLEKLTNFIVYKNQHFGLKYIFIFLFNLGSVFMHISAKKQKK